MFLLRIFASVNHCGLFSFHALTHSDKWHEMREASQASYDKRWHWNCFQARPKVVTSRTPCVYRFIVPVRSPDDRLWSPLAYGLTGRKKNPIWCQWKLNGFISKYDACGFYLVTASCMQRWMTMSRIPSRDTAAFESNLKFLNIDETVIRSQPIVNGRKLEAVLKLAFYGSQVYAENIIRCIGMFSLLTRILKWYRKVSAQKHIIVVKKDECTSVRLRH